MTTAGISESCVLGQSPWRCLQGLPSSLLLVLGGCLRRSVSSWNRRERGEFSTARVYPCCGGCMRSQGVRKRRAGRRHPRRGRGGREGGSYGGTEGGGQVWMARVGPMTHGVCDMRGRGWGKACCLRWTDLSPFLPGLGSSAALPLHEFLHAHTRSQRQSLLRQGRHHASALRRLPLLLLGAGGCLLPRFLSVRQDLDRDVPEPLLRFRHGSERDGRRTGRGSSPVAPSRGS